MKANGTLTFTRQADGLLTYQWRGGRRIAITYTLLKDLNLRPSGVVEIGGIRLRIITIVPAVAGQGHCTVYIAMREGWLARLTRLRVDALTFLALQAARVDHWFLHGHRASECPSPVYDWPRWSLAGILSRLT